MQKDFPIVSTGINENGNWCVKPLELGIFMRLAEKAIAALAPDEVDLKEIERKLAFVLAEVEPLPETEDVTTNIFQANIWELQAEAAMKFLAPYLRPPSQAVSEEEAIEAVMLTLWGEDWRACISSAPVVSVVRALKAAGFNIVIGGD